MTAINLIARDRQAVQAAVEQLQDADSADRDLFFQGFPRGNENVIRRFVRGAYNHPITWWIGIFQLQMQKGMWGRRHQAVASRRASILAQSLYPVWNEVVSVANGGDAPVLSGLVRYNVRYRKADLSGRFVGGQFTSYASTAGRYGNTRLSTTAGHVRMVTNFGIASYGAAIKAVVMGYRRADALVQGVLTGRPETLPASYLRDSDDSLSAEEVELLQTLGGAVGEMTMLARVAPSPVPIAEFCARPENVNLTGVCQ